MKIMQISVVLLVFFFINVQVEGGIEFNSSGASPTSIIKFVLDVFTFVLDVINPDNTQVNVVKILEQVGDISIKLDTFDTHMNNKLDTMLDTLMAAIKVTPSLEYSKTKLFQYISKIDRYFDNSREYKFGGMLGNDTLENFATSALWCGDNLPNTLQELNDLFIANVNKPGFLSLMHQQNSIKRVDDCDKYQSSQLQVYYIYIQLMIAEVKGLLTLGQIFMLQRLFDKTSHNYLPEMEIVKTNFVKRMTTYHEVFSKDLNLFHRGLRRCEVQSPKRDVDFLELENFCRIFILNLAFTEKIPCFGCPTETQLRDLTSDYTIHDCEKISTMIKYCLAEPDTSRELMWWRDSEKIQYGHDATCYSTETLIRPEYVVLKQSTSMCDVCACSKYQNKTRNTDNWTIWRVSVSEQMSDRWNNMVVTGVQLYTWNNALHLQIQQNSISNYGLSYNESQWKELDNEYHEYGMTQYSLLKYESLNYNRRTLHLDEIMAPDQYVITGVRFELNDNSEFKLGVHATRYNAETGQLYLSDSLWMLGDDFPVNNLDYDRNRIEIDINKSDDPTRASGFQYDSESNKKIKFTFTDMKKDAGQMTIPLLDAHYIETQPPSPLSGIGLLFRGKMGFGGYIAPHIYTVDAMNYMKYNFSQLLNAFDSN